MREPLIAGNWKMNATLTEAMGLVQAMLVELDGITGIEKVLCPPFVSLAPVKELIKGTSIRLGAQNMYFEDKGAYTGEISPVMLVGLCDYVILGHSERRQYFGETDEIVNKKLKTALRFELRPILCVGESLNDNEVGRTEEIIIKQLEAALFEINPTSQLAIAYEPIWAIGTGKAATGRQANTTIGLIRNTVASLWTDKIAQTICILYGGSATGDNITEFVSEPEIDGALVGGASLKAASFLTIASKTAELRAKA